MSWNIVCIRGEIEVRDVQLFELEFALFQYFTNLYISEEDIMPFLSIYLLLRLILYPVNDLTVLGGGVYKTIRLQEGRGKWTILNKIIVHWKCL